MLQSLFISTLLFFMYSPEQNLMKVKVNEHITMAMPSDFRPMTDDEIADRYFTMTRPLALFTNSETAVDLGVNKSITRWRSQDLQIMADFQKSNIFSLYDKVDVIKEGIKEVNGRQFAFIEFVSSVEEAKDAMIKKGSIRKYTYIQYTILNGFSLVFNFTCPSNIQNQWQPQMDGIMNNITVKKSFK